MTKGNQRALVVSPMKSWQKIHARAERDGCQHRTPFSKCAKKAFYMLNGKGYCEEHKPGREEA